MQFDKQTSGNSRKFRKDLYVIYHGIFHGIFMVTTKVDKMGRTVIPSSIRKILNLKEGDRVEWSLEEGKVVVRKKLPMDRDAIKKRFNELRRKAPDCFTEEEEEAEDKWALEKWALAKLGL